MLRDKLYELMQEPALLTEETMPLLKGMIEKYPWFPTVRMLYLKNLKCVESAVFDDELRNNAIYIADRKKLYNYLYSVDSGQESLVEISENGTEDDPFFLIDSFLTAQGTMATFAPGSPLPIHPSVSTDYILWAYSNPANEERKEEKEPEVPLKHQDLIDSFLVEEENRQPGERMLRMEENEEKAPALTLGDEEYEKSLDDSYFTETLARIYVKQRRYDKALQIIQKLSLNYPEKNIYFADQIRFLEKLIINTKK